MAATSVPLARRLGALPLCLVVLAACGAATGSELGPEPDAGFDGGVVDTGLLDGMPIDGNVSDAGRVCIAHCTSDLECQSTCPNAPGHGVNCCDFPSGVCFLASPGMCPMFVNDASLD